MIGILEFEIQISDYRFSRRRELCSAFRDDDAFGLVPQSRSRVLPSRLRDRPRNEERSDRLCRAAWHPAHDRCNRHCDDQRSPRGSPLDDGHLRTPAHRGSPPVTCKKAIYLDADCLVASELSQLWAIDLSTNIVAGVIDRPAIRRESEFGRRRDLNKYVNAGVMLLNLDAWRAEGVAEATLAYARDHVVPYSDQSAINAVASDRILNIPEYWNVMVHSKIVDPGPTIEPRIIHFCGTRRPWLHRETMFMPIYIHHRSLTPFPMDAPTKFYRSRLHHVLNFLALRKKYWRMVLRTRHYNRTFTIPYLKTISRRS